MQQLILTSVMMATFAIPALVIRRGGAERFVSVLAPFLLFVAVYVVLLLFVYPRLF